MEQFVVSAIKYRPLSFASVVGQSTIGATLKNAIQRGHLSHAYLFCGPRGVGKTTCARIFAKTINCLNPGTDMEACGECESCRSFAEGRSYCIHELDAASNNSVDDIRMLVDQVRVPPQTGKYSVYIIDEVHMLSASAFNAFLKTLEEPPSYAIFILATTEKHKIISTILSRCQIYDFNRITISDIVSHLKNIALKEEITCEPDAFNIIARKADGAMRDALSIFDRVVSFCGNNITYSAVIDDLNVLDYDYYFRLTDALLAHNYVETYIILDEVLKKGFDAQHFVAGLNVHFRDILVCKDVQTISLLEVGQSIAERYKQQSAACSVDFLYEALNIVNKCEMEYKLSGNPRLLVELTLLNLSYIGTGKKNELSEQHEQQEIKITHATAPKKNEPIPIPEVPKSISLKEMLVEVKIEKNTAAEVAEATETLVTTEKKTFTEEQLVAEWRNYAEKVKAQLPRLSSRLLEYSPKLVSERLVQYPVVSEQYREQMEKRSTDLIEHLKKTLNASISVEWTVLNVNADEDNVNDKTRLYSQKDKIKYIISANNAIDGIIKDLDLDYR
ncbi:MAG: DNA polymerase III subunit gamma/tau [Prevotellaceae bacterium]|jgi:DNA polymerase-3 subunit gamma/tau|nr:DNA polymerase III subunit gamma/tau [Prevotellaceae bacterium]